MCFVARGFRNWKKAIDAFRSHEASECHSFALEQLQNLKGMSIDAQMSNQKLVEQQNAQQCLRIIITSVQFLARQGLALRGHELQSGNLYELLRVRGADVPYLQTWLNRTTNFTSPDCQNEILKLLSDSVLRSMTQSINSSSGQFGVIMDGTQDCGGVEQESICVRYVDENLEIHEVFVGLYEPETTTGTSLASVIKDVLLRLGLPIGQLRAQTYDGAAAMAGARNGCQNIIKQDQPLALHFHCSAHCTNLIAMATIESSPLLRDALQWINEISALYNRSLKLKKIMKSNFAAEGPTTLKPLCPTRWLCRAISIQSFLKQYAEVLNSLETMKDQSAPETSAKCSGLLNRLEDGTTVLALEIALLVLLPLENLNQCLQARDATLTGMMQSVSKVTLHLQSMRSDEMFQQVLAKSKSFVEKHDLQPIALPRKRCPPARLTGPAKCHQPSTVDEHFRLLYFSILDNTIQQLGNRFNNGSPGLTRYLSLETILLTGESSESVIDLYPELNNESLKIQLAMFCNQHKYSSLAGARLIMSQMSADVRRLFSQVERLIRLMLLCPVTSCEAERSFSALRRLKTWLRTTMTQHRLNHIALCHVHQSKLDEVDITEVSREFARRSQIRMGVFGKF